MAPQTISNTVPGGGGGRVSGGNPTAATATTNPGNRDNAHVFDDRNNSSSKNNSDRRWVTVSWMPHASLSATSNVCLKIKSILTSLDVTDPIGMNVSSRHGTSSSGGGVANDFGTPRQDWKVSATVHGVAGIDLVPVSVMTRSAPLVPIKKHSRPLLQHNQTGSSSTRQDMNQPYPYHHPRNNWSSQISTGITAPKSFLSISSSQQSSPLPSSSSPPSSSWEPLVADATHICRFDELSGQQNHSGGERMDERSPNSSHRPQQQQQQQNQQQCILHIPIRWRELPRDAYLKFQVIGPTDNLLYSATFPLFDAHGMLRTGLQRIPLHDPRANNESRDFDTLNDPANPGLLSLPNRSEKMSKWQVDDNDPQWKASRILDELNRFAISNSHSTATGATNISSRDGGSASRPSSETMGTGSSSTGRLSSYGDIASVPWLDDIGREYCQQVLNDCVEKSDQVIAVRNSSNDGCPQVLPASYLVIELPRFDIPILYEETPYPPPQQGPSGSVTPLDMAMHYTEKGMDVGRATSNKTTKNDEISAIDPPPFHPLDMIPFLDYEDENDNPVDDKYRTLAHDLIRGQVDPTLKPDRTQRDQLAAIIASPSHHPTLAERDLLWKFRFSLVDNRRALTKFLLAVDWGEENEVVQAAELLEQWRKRSPIEVTDALKLLGKQVAYQTNLVRSYAIDTLARAPDEELVLYLLQLVQALKFENVQEAAGLGRSKKSSLATFLIGRASRNVELATYLYWYLKVELQDPVHGARFQEIFAEFQHSLSQTPFPYGVPSPSTRMQSSNVPQKSHAGTDVVVTGTNNPSEAVKLGDSLATITPFNKLVESVSKFGDKLMGGDPQSPESFNTKNKSRTNPNRSVWDVLTEQDTFISGIMDVQLSYATKPKQIAKQSHLRTVLARDGYDRNPNGLPFPLPCAPQILVNGIQPQKAKVFKSAVYPALIEFNVDRSGVRSRKGDRSTNSLSSYRVMMKTGDDLRQDQLAMMMIKLMDGLLKRSSLDLCITSYSIIATSHSSGMIEFVEDSSPISQVLNSHNNSILRFLQSCAPQKGTKYGVRPEVMSTYIRSVAGESVITYLLGVGDRHLDNLMITQTGNLFHIDFGFLFGRDPKPFPPAFRLTREMIDGMGGVESAEYRQFCSLACQAFNSLRKSAGLILNLLHLMSDAGIEDLSNNPSADAEGVIGKVEERFRLDLTDEQAERFFLNLINDTLAAWAPKVTDWVHAMAVARR